MAIQKIGLKAPYKLTEDEAVDTHHDADSEMFYVIYEIDGRVFFTAENDNVGLVVWYEAGSVDEVWTAIMREDQYA